MLAELKRLLYRIVNKYKDKHKRQELMKPFSGLYSQYSAAKLNNFHSGYGSPSTNPTNKSASNNKFVKGTPLKNKNVFQPKIKTNIRQRLSRSIQQVHIQSDDDSLSLFKTSKVSKQQSKGTNRGQILIQNCQQQSQFYNQSYQKLSKVYKNFTVGNQNKNCIEQQLSQILVLIREERQMIKNKLQQIQSKRKSKITVQTSQNTDPIITNLNQLTTANIQVQTQAQVQLQKQKLNLKQQQKNKQREQVSSNQTYAKLIKILQDMNINSRQILPQQIKIDNVDQDKKYQQLKDSQIITVQKFVIKKLVQRISALQMQQNA